MALCWLFMLLGFLEEASMIQLTLDVLCLGLLSVTFALHLWFDEVAASQSKIEIAMQVDLPAELL